MSILIIGGGYLGTRLGIHLIAQQQVTVITRSLLRHEQLRRTGMQPHALDITLPHFFFDLTPFSHIIFCPAVTADRKKTGARHKLYVEGLAHILNLMEQQNAQARLTVIGSSSLFPNQRHSAETMGNTHLPELFDINEEALPNLPYTPENPTLEQYKLWEKNQSRLAVPSLYIISSGIYGPSRHPARKLIQGLRETHSYAGQWLNLIHIDDLVQIILWSLNRKMEYPVICATSHKPLTLQAFYSLYTSALHLPAVQFGQDLSAGYDGKRVSNKLLLSLGYNFIHPEFSARFIEEHITEITIDPTQPQGV